MPALPAVHHVIKCEAIYTDSASSRGLVNVFHVGYTGVDITTSQLDTIATDMDNAINNAQTTFMSSALTLAETVYTDLTTNSSPRVVHSPALAGGNSGTRAPASAAAVQSWAIARRYRGGHPRTYVGGLVSSLISPPDLITGVFRTNLAAAGNAFITAVGAIAVAGNSYELGAVSYFANHSLRGTPIFDPFLSCSVHQRLDTQRRRLGKETI